MKNKEIKELPELKLKILILGETAVGKTCMLLKYTDNTFSEKHLATIGVEYKEKIINTPKYKVNLHIWDTAGQERFKALTRTFFNGTNGVIFVYDITNKKSFEGVKDWINDGQLQGDYKAIICGNKIDLEKSREVKFESLKEFGLKKNMEVFETSAKDGINIKEAFERLVDLILKSKSDKELIREYGDNQGKNIILNQSEGKGHQLGNCCKK